jgi:DNA modification methylase
VNYLYYGDNLDVLRESVDTASVDLVYLDPPFNSNRSYNVLFADRSGEESQAQIEAFDDTWTWSHDSEAAFEEIVKGGAPPRAADAIDAIRRLLGDNDVLAYLVMMTQRLIELHRVLRRTGSMYLHCDPTASHYLKVLLDAIFGPENFRSEIIWRRYGAHNDAKGYGAVHDVLLYYGASKTVRFTKQYQEYDAAYIAERFRFEDPDGRKWSEQNLSSPNPRPNLTYPFTAPNGTTYEPPPNGWKYTPDRMQVLAAEGRLHYPRKQGARLRLKNYLDEMPGVPPQDVWTDIGPIGGTNPERLGYPTQKPEALLERIVQSSSDEGDVVLDPFCGCGTTVAVAQQLRRQWVGIDITYIAVDLIDKRLRATYGEPIRSTYEIHGIPRDLAGAQALFASNAFDFERWAVSLVNGQPHARHEQAGDRGVDGWVRFAATATDRGRAVVSVKGGRQLNPSMVRDLRGTVESQRADMGVLVTLEQPTRGMVQETRRSGSYVHPLTGRTHPRLQIVTVAQLLAGEPPDMPAAFLPYVQAKRGSMAQQGTLGM